MSNLEDLIKSTNISVVEYNYAEVDATWYKFVYFFPYYRIYYIADGEADLYLEDYVLHLKPKHLYFIPSFQVKTSKSFSVLKHYYVHFKISSSIIPFLEIVKPKFEIPADMIDEELFKDLINTNNCDSLSSILKVDGILKYFLSKFYNGIDIDNTITESQRRLIPVLNYINENLTKELTISKLSEIAMYNETYFSSIFKKTFGISPIAYINNKKMNTAYLMIQEKNKSIKEIIEELGFNNYSHFFKLFKQTYGITPLKCRRDVMDTKKVD